MLIIIDHYKDTDKGKEEKMIKVKVDFILMNSSLGNLKKN